MKSLVRKAMRGDIADAIQNTILICFEKIHTLKQPRYFKTWMIRILINECNQIIRRYGNQCLLEEFPEVPVGDTSMEYVEFQQLMNALDEKNRMVLILYYAEGFKISEIAELLHLPEGTVKTRLSRGRESLASEETFAVDQRLENSDIAVKEVTISPISFEVAYDWKRRKEPVESVDPDGNPEICWEYAVPSVQYTKFRLRDGSTIDIRVGGGSRGYASTDETDHTYVESFNSDRVYPVEDIVGVIFEDKSSGEVYEVPIQDVK